MFTNLYSWFQGLFGAELFDYLAGYDCEAELTQTNFLFAIGLSVFLLTAIVNLMFYFIPHVSFSRWYHWLLTMVVVSVLSGVIGWGIAYGQMGNMPAYALYGVNQVVADGDGSNCDSLVAIAGADPVIRNSNFIMFGLANVIISFALFFIMTFVVRWFSKQCRLTPFPR